MACFHSLSFYTKMLSPSSSSTASLYTSFIDLDIYQYLRKKLTSIKIPSDLYSTPDIRERQFGKYGQCYYCCLFRTDDMIDQSNLTIDKRLDIVGNYASSIFFFELAKQDINADKSHLRLDENFFRKFHSLELISLTNVRIDSFEIHSKDRSYLKYISYILLENNEISKIGVDFRYLKRLKYLRLERNPIEALPLNCLSNKSLQTISLLELGRLNELDSNMKISSDLKTLDIQGSILTALPSTLFADTQTKLTKLTLNGVPWWRPDGIGVNEIVRYDAFQKQFLPFLSEDELLVIYRMYDNDENGVLTYSEINAMNAHVYLYISRLRPSTATPTNTNESELSQQDSFAIDASGLPSVIFQFRNLTELNLNYQGIKTVPDAIKNLTQLTVLSLSHCIELETLSAHVGFLPLKELNLTGCVSLKTPPIEITRRGHTQTMAFLQRLISGSVTCKRTKLMLVGLGGAGKTSLVRAFLQSSSDTPPVVTDGIDILKWRVPLENSDDYLEFSVWDFAGQSVYYHTHQVKTCFFC